MANPRKFSEKIALHNQKQAEGDAEFKRILEEVSGAIKGASPQNRLNSSQNEPINNQFNNGTKQHQAQSNHISLQQTHQQQQQQQQQQQLIQQQQNQQLYNDQNGQTILINQQQTSNNHLSPNNILTEGCRADSLPNGVNNLTANEKSRSSIDLRSALNNLNEMTQSTQGELKKSNSRNRMPSPNNHHLSRHQQQLNQPNAATAAIHQRHHSQHQQYQQYNGSYNEFNLNANQTIPTQSRSQINLHSYALQTNQTNDQQFVHKSNHHNSHRINPYYLSAPESNWRRTNSDSALNQTYGGQQQLHQQQQTQQQPTHLNQQIYQQNQLNQNQMFDLHQRQKQVIIQQQQQQQMTTQDLNKCDNQLNNQQQQQTDLTGNSGWDPGKQSTNNQQSPQTTVTQAPVISINYNQQQLQQQQQITFSSSINNNNTNNVQPMYTSSVINQNVQCTQTNYVNNMNQTGNGNYSIQQQQQSQTNKRPKSCDQENDTLNSSQFNRNNATIINQLTAQNRNQLPTLQFQSSSQNNMNQLNDQSAFSNLNSTNIDHHHSSIHVNTNSNTDSSTNFLYANTNTCSGSLPDLSLFNSSHQQQPLVVPLDQDALSSGLNSNDNSNNSNQSALSSSSYQFSGMASSVPCSSVLNSPMNYRANQTNSNFVQYNCSNPNSSNSNSPLHQNGFSNLTNAQQQIANQQQSMNVVNLANSNNSTSSSNINFNNFTNKLQSDCKFINQQITNNQLANQFHNHHISSPVRPSSVESTDDSSVIFNQLTGNDMLINELENDENIEQFDFDLFSNQDSQNDKLITNDQLDKLNCDSDTNNNDTNNIVNSFYQDNNQLMNHRNVSTPSENASTPASPASSILNLNSPISSPSNQSNNATSVQINSICNNNLANMNLNNDNNLSQNSTILPNKNDFLINETNCMITNDQQQQQMDTAETNCSKDKNGIMNDDDYLQLNTFRLDASFESNKTDNNQYLNNNNNENNIFNDSNLNNKDQDLILNYDLNTSNGIPNIIVWPEHREHNGDLSSIDELTY